MAQDDKKDAEYQFPEGYEYMKEMADEAARQSKELDERIKNIPSEDIQQTRHRLQFNPPGAARAENAWAKRENREDLEKQKKQIETDLMKRIDHDMKQNDVDAQTSGQVKQAAVEVLHPNPFKDKSTKELEVARGMDKDPQHSQDFMRKLLSDQKKSEKTQDNLKPEKVEEKQQTEMSMSARFNHTLGYTKYTEKTQQVMEKQPIINKGKEPDKE
ncbi:hypothetical protein [Dyadobacter sp. 32]|uniref:hypothetical protein n=1 Tax=Dyadobacter sp. 32 TaxID=538966 RepID=UPI0011EC870F